MKAELGDIAMTRPLKQLAADYKSNDSGHFAVIFSLMAVPLLAVSTFVIDYTSAGKVRMDLANALDDAALAAVLDQSLTEKERKDYATHYFWSFFEPDADIDFEVRDASAERVSLRAHVKVPTTISAAVGVENIDVVETAVSQLTKGDVVCMLALDPDSEESFKVSHGATLTAKDCSVQVNSVAPEASVVNHGGEASAKSFCMSGGAVGDYTPFFEYGLFHY